MVLCIAARRDLSVHGASSIGSVPTAPMSSAMDRVVAGVDGRSTGLDGSFVW